MGTPPLARIGHGPRYRGRLAAAVLAVLLCGLVGASAALAHSSIESSEPSLGSTVDDLPDPIRITFVSPIRPESAEVSLAVATADGAEVVAVDVRPEGEATLLVSPAEVVPAGDVALAIVVVAADGHELTDTLTFTLSAASQGPTTSSTVAPSTSTSTTEPPTAPSTGPPTTLLPTTVSPTTGPPTTAPAAAAAESGDSSSAALAAAQAALDDNSGVTTAIVLVRALVYLATFLLLGGLTFGIVAGRTPASVDRLTMAAAIAFVALGIVRLGLQVVREAGGRWGALTDGGAWGDTLGAPVGRAMIGLVVVGVMLALAARGVSGGRGWPSASTRSPWAWVVPVGVVAVLVAYGQLSHITESGPAGVGRAVLAAHIAALAVWVGGLAALVLRPAAPDGAEAARFSRVATVAAPLAIFSGVLLAWLRLDAVSDFTGTAYGRRLLAKVVVVAVILGLGALNRSRVAARPAAIVPTSRTELALVVVVAFLTSWMIAVA